MIFRFGWRSNRPVEHHADHRDRGVIGPAQAPPHLVARFLLALVVGHRRGARRMQPDRRVQLRHGGEERLELVEIERLAGDVGIDQRAGRAQRVDGAARLVDRAFHVGHAQRGGEGRKALRVLVAERRHLVIGDARQRQARFRRGDVLDRRVGQRDDLAVVAEGVHLLEARVEVEQLGDAAQARADVLELGRDLHHLLEETVRDRCGNRCRRSCS